MMNLDKMSPIHEPVRFDCAVTACHIHAGKKQNQKQTVSVDGACSENILWSEKEDTFSQFPTEERSH